MSDEGQRGAFRTALAVREPPPPTRVARNLQVASSRELVHVDSQGRVRSPARLRLLQASSYGMLAAVVGGSTALYCEALGSAGVLVGGIVGAWLAYCARHGFVLRRGVRYLAADRLAEAGATFSAVTRTPAVPRRIRALAEQNLALVRNLEGRHQEALALYRSAMTCWQDSRKLMPMLARYGEVHTLVRLDRLEEARERLTALAPVPAGEYLEIHHWTVELYLCLAEGRHTLGADELYTRARAALAITSAAGLLGLLAWAHQQLGDAPMSDHLRAECLDRHPGARLSRFLPLLQRWLDQ